MPVPQKQQKILIIDDDVDVLHSARMFLKQYFAQVDTEPNPREINRIVSQNQYEAVLLDMNFKRGEHDGREGLYWLERILTIAPQTAVILITAYGDIELAVEAMRQGAASFVLKPWKNSKLLETIETALAQRQKSGSTSARQTASPPAEIMDMIGQSDAMHQVYTLVNKVADTDANVLIMGENGTGKDLVAQALHRQSSRRKGPFVRVDLGAITASLFESELFGHTKGAFTDAYHDKAGKFELAREGTLFLDEIGNLSLPQQAKLLTVLQKRTLTRVGANQEIPLNIRLICATNMPLYHMAAAQEESFRQDLLYRINTVEIFVPPLRNRPEDIPLLARHFLQVYAAQYHKPVAAFSPAAMSRLQQYGWPGNVRELQHAIERAVILCEGDVIDAPHFTFNSAASTVMPATVTDLTLDENEKHFIQQVLQRHQGNVTQTAKALGITRTALYRRLGKYGL